MNKNKEKNNKIRKLKFKTYKPIALLIVLILVAFLSPKIISTARYVYNVAHEYYLMSKDFYFASDILTRSGLEYEITNNWTGAERYKIPVNMSSKKNDKAVIDADITYDITVSCSDNVTATPSKNSGTILGYNHHYDDPPLDGLNGDYFEVYVYPANNTPLPEGAKAWVDITVESTSPYVQQLSGRIKISVGSAEISYEIIDAVNQPYLTVNITNSQSVGADVTLSYDPTDVLLDMTDRFYLNSTDTDDETINTYTYLNSVTSFVDSLSTTTVKFYKIDPTQNYSYSGTGTPIITLTTLNAATS